MSARIAILIENRKNTGTDPNTTAQLPNAGKSHKFSSLSHDLNPQPSSLPKILATHLSFNAPGNQTVNIDDPNDPGKKDYSLKSGSAPTAISDGDAVDISGWSAIAK